MFSTLRPSGLSRVVNERNGRTAPTRWGCTLPPPRRLSAPGRAAARWPLLTMRGGGDSGAGNAPVALRLRSANPTGPVAGDAESKRSRAATFSDTMGPVPSAQCPSDARRKPARAKAAVAGEMSEGFDWTGSSPFLWTSARPGLGLDREDVTVEQVLLSEPDGKRHARERVQSSGRQGSARRRAR